MVDITPETGGSIAPYITEPDVEDPIRILIVDDSDFDCRQLERHCQRTDLTLRIDTARDVSVMEKMLNSKTYDIIFVDYFLSHSTGLEARAIIKGHERNGHAATIMITGEVNHEVAVSAIKGGCEDYLSKQDLDPALLKLVIERATTRLEHHATRILRQEMDDIHDRTMGAVTEVVRRELSDERIVSLLVYALGKVTYVDGLPVVTELLPPPIGVQRDEDDPLHFVFR